MPQTRCWTGIPATHAPFPAPSALPQRTPQGSEEWQRARSNRITARWAHLKLLSSCFTTSLVGRFFFERAPL